MRASDGVDLALGLAPRRWVQLFLFLLVALMSVTGWYEPVLWYARDRATGITETWLPVFERLAQPSVTAPPAP